MSTLGDATLVVMAGGSGTRFWPKSTSKLPKQLISFGGRESLLVQTITRFDGLVATDRRMIVTTQALGGTIKDLCKKANREVRVLEEPMGRNTAPCIFWAAKEIARNSPKGLMIVMPSDSYIAKVEAFRATIKMACGWATRTGNFVTLGIEPTRPETGYGYLHKGSSLELDCFSLKAFVEKPDLARAEKFLASREYLWNGGMFIWRVDQVLEAFSRYMPEMEKVWNECQGDIARAYPKFTAVSIDYGIMEKAALDPGKVVTFALNCGWDDLGSWTSLESVASEWGIEQEGQIVGSGEVVAVDSKGNIVDAQGKCVALLGVNDLIIAQNGDRILIADKSRAQDVKLVIEALKKKRPDLA